MAPPVGGSQETIVTRAEGADVSDSGEHNEPRELTIAEKFALTKLKNAQRVNNLEENVHDIYKTIRQLSTSVSDMASRQDGLPDLIS